MERKILGLFANAHMLKFSDIEKALKIRSNKLNYHIKKLLKKGALTKRNEKYMLSNESEHLIPYMSQNQAPLPVTLIHIGDTNACFLYERIKRPYKGYLSLPGGRILLGESLKDSVKRIMKEKYNIPAELTKIHSVSLENVKREGKTIHSFVLFFVSAKALAPLTNLSKNKGKIIKSDYALLKKDLKKKIKISTINSHLRE